MKKKPYWILVVKDSSSSPWEVAFGDYDKETVREESHEYSGYFMIIKTTDAQESIDKIVQGLNSGCSPTRKEKR